jgi:hypothetical protein
LIVLIANAHPYLVVLDKPFLLRKADKGAKMTLLTTEAESTERPQPLQGSEPIKKPGRLLQPGHVGCHRRVRTLPYPMNAPAFIRHGSLRPASRDLSGGARSGNANQIIRHMKQASHHRQSS